jgi:triosephosphate isomerase
MPRKMAAGNWKMNGTQADLVLLDALAHGQATCDVVICPPATLLTAAAARTAATSVAVGAQTCHAAAKGAHTGDLSAAMIAETGATHVIVGHSERREAHGETDADVAAQAKAAQAAGLVPIVCLGESEAQRDAGEALQVIAAQLKGSVPDGSTAATLVIAYEPIWAIGTGKIPSMEQIEEVHAALRRDLVERFEAEGEEMRLLYGGSVKAGNAAEIFAVANVDGALVGGASLTHADFAPIVQALSAA